MTSKIRITEISPIQDTLRKAGYIAALSVEGAMGSPNVFMLLKREDLEELYASSHDILGDNPEPKPEVEKVAWPGQSDFRDESRERAVAINAVRMAGHVS